MQDYWDFYHDCCQVVPENAFCARARQKTIYQFDNTGNDNSNEIVKELASFYYMCGNRRFNDDVKPSPVYDHFFQLQRSYHLNMLPQHNAVAFFQGLMELCRDEARNGEDKKLPQRESYFMLKHLLPYVLPCRGFVFGSSFYAEGVYCIHPCDLDYVIFPDYDSKAHMEFDRNVLFSQAELRMARLFPKERGFYTKTVMSLSREKERIEEWYKEASDKGKVSANSDHPKPWTGDLEKLEEMFWAFFEIYRNYCVNQGKSIEADLDRLKKAAHAIFKMEQMYRDLCDIMKITDKTENVCAKQKWLETIQAEISTPDMWSGIEALRKPLHSEDIPELYKLLAAQDTLSRRQTEQYPILNRKLPIAHLGRNERTALRWYIRSKVARIIDWLYCGEQRSSLRKIMPHYLLHLFTNDGKPLNPFKKRPYDFGLKRLNFHEGISFCKHPTVKHKQELDYCLYQDILVWCDRYFKGEWDRPLCNALYTFCRLHLVTREPSSDTQFVHNELAVLKEGIWRVFDMPISLFPQRTQIEVSANEFYDFYYYNTEPDVKTVRKALKEHIITEEDAENYKALVFLDVRGFGCSFHPNEWYDKIEDWLTGIINRNEAILQYINAAGADTAFRQAQIDLAIQFICCRKIQEDMTKEVLTFCKEVFSPDCKSDC